MQRAWRGAGIGVWEFMGISLVPRLFPGRFMHFEQNNTRMEPIGGDYLDKISRLVISHSYRECMSTKCTYIKVIQMKEIGNKMI